MRVTNHKVTIPGADEPIWLCLVLDSDNQLMNVLIGASKPEDVGLDFMDMTPDFFWVVFGDIAKNVYEEAVS